MLFKGSRKSNKDLPQAVSDIAASQQDSRYTLDVSEIDVLYRFFTNLSSSKVILPLIMSAYRTEAVYGPLAERLAKEGQTDKQMPLFFTKWMAAAQLATLATQFLGKSTGKDGKQPLYTFDLSRFIEHGNNLRIVVAAAQNVKKRSKHFPDGSLPNDDMLITKLEAYHADFLQRKEALARGISPDKPVNTSSEGSIPTAE
jgi:hypothetical protein